LFKLFLEQVNLLIIIYYHIIYHFNIKSTNHAVNICNSCTTVAVKAQMLSKMATHI